MRILWHSVAPWIKTGYGTQTEIFTRRIRDLLGHEVAISTWSKRSGLMEHNGFKIYPGSQEPFGNDVVASHARDWGADLVITLTDSMVFKPRVMRKIPWVAWAPIDHAPVPPAVKNALTEGYGVPVALSQFGVEQMQQAGLSPLYVPHACHQDFFERTTKEKARKKLGLPAEAYIVGMVGVNQGVPNRKSYPQCLEAFKRFRQKHKEAYLVMHTNPNDSQGLNLMHLIEHLGLAHDCYSFPEKYQMLLGYSETYLRDLYTAMDVFLTPNMGEGFGVPIIEAQACGTPIIGTDFSTMPELRFYGELVKSEPFYTRQSSFQSLPAVDGILRALYKVYDYDSEKMKKGTAHARRSMHKHYHPDTVTKTFWRPVLESAKDRIGSWSYDQ